VVLAPGSLSIFPETVRYCFCSVFKHTRYPFYSIEIVPSLIPFSDLIHPWSGFHFLPFLKVILISSGAFRHHVASSAPLFFNDLSGLLHSLPSWLVPRRLLQFLGDGRIFRNRTRHVPLVASPSPAVQRHPSPLFTFCSSQGYVRV